MLVFGWALTVHGVFRLGGRAFGVRSWLFGFEGMGSLGARDRQSHSKEQTEQGSFVYRDLRGPYQANGLVGVYRCDPFVRIGAIAARFTHSGHRSPCA